MKKKKLWLIPVVILIVLAVVLAIFHQAVYLVFRNLTVGKLDLDESVDNWTGGTVYKQVQYADVSPTDYVDLYLPDGVENPPLYVIIHGGGFVSGDSYTRQAQFMYRYFRDRGYACASVNYRLAQEAAFPAGVEDCKAAIRFLRAHSAEYGYNADRIAVFGESAGGYLAAMCAFTNDDEFNDLPFIGQEELGNVSAKVDVLVDYYGVMEWGIAKDLPAIGLPQFIYNIANSWLSKDEMEGFSSFESYWLRQEVSSMTDSELAVSDPYTYLNENVTPDCGLSVWMVHGDCDITVPCPQSDRLYEKLDRILPAGDLVFHRVPDMGHASDPLYKEEELEQIKAFLDERMR